MNCNKKKFLAFSFLVIASFVVPAVFLLGCHHPVTLIYCTIAFDLNYPDATDSIEDISVLRNVDVSLPQISRTGYRFLGWNTKPDGTGTDFSSGVTPTENMMLYAKWQPNSYNVVFHRTTADLPEELCITQSFLYDQEQKLRANSFESNCYFVCWRDVLKGYFYEDGEVVKNLTTEDNATIHLYAEWSSADIILMPTTHGSMQKGVRNNKIIITLTPDEAYELESISVVTEDGSVIDAVADSDNPNVYSFTMSMQDVTVTATFRLAPCTVTFVTDCSVQVASQSVEYGSLVEQPADLPDNAEAKDFLGWYTDETFTDEFNFNSEITEPTSVYAKWGCFKVTDETIADRIRNLKYPCAIIANVTKINHEQFLDCTKLTSITICNGVTSIGERAFFNCTNLSSVELGDSVTSIGECAFYNCTGLTSISIPDSVINIDFNAFGYCTGLRSVTIGNGLTSMTGGVFSNCTGLTSVTFSDTTSIWYTDTNDTVIEIGTMSDPATNATWLTDTYEANHLYNEKYVAQ